ncbi:MAG: BrxE family protein [Deltaproteobacteria bacterium]|nr:BrxE family protein [Deltaproteobacteria bacterium]
MVDSLERQSGALLHLRVLVLTLGEAPHAKWWRTQFLTETGLRFLERLYPRTYGASAVQAAGAAARILHDSSIGRGGVYHLFRLPDSLEQRIHSLMLGGNAETIVTELKPVLGDRVALQERLSAFATDTVEAQNGPQRLGNSLDLERPKIVEKIAAVYTQAFQKNERVFPYFDVERPF